MRSSKQSAGPHAATPAPEYGTVSAPDLRRRCSFARVSLHHDLAPSQHPTPPAEHYVSAFSCLQMLPSFVLTGAIITYLHLGKDLLIEHAPGLVC